MNKKSLVIVVLGVLLMVPLASAGLFDFLTGKATVPLPTNVSVEITTDTAPQVISVTPQGPKDPVEGGIRTISVNFTAKDADGAAEINTASYTLDLSRTCAFAGGGTWTAQASGTCTSAASISDPALEVDFTCAVDMPYYFCSGAYAINATISDTPGGKLGFNDTEIFTYNQLLALEITPGNIDFGAIQLGDTLVPSLQNTVVSNTANKELSSLSLTAIDLVGESNNAYVFHSENFSAQTSNSSISIDPCTTINSLSNGAPVSVTTGPLPYVRSDTMPDNTATIKYCIPQVPNTPDLIKQSYTTSIGGPWYVGFA